MREIKFKAYDTERKKWLDSDDLIFQGGLWFENFRALEDYVALDLDSGKIKIVQYTGFEDSEGKELYESDIVADEKGELFKIEFKCGKFGINVKKRGSFFSDEKVDVFYSLENYFYYDEKFKFVCNANESVKIDMQP